MSEDVAVFIASSPAETEEFAAGLGKNLRGGEIIELVGDVGAGKTSFVRGMVRGAGSSDRVSSPTFTISQLYKTTSLRIYHYDFYRITDAAIMTSELSDVIGQAGTVVVLEWAGAVEEVLPTDHITIRFEVSDETARTLDCSIPQKYKYLEAA